MKTARTSSADRPGDVDGLDDRPVDARDGTTTRSSRLGRPTTRSVADRRAGAATASYWRWMNSIIPTRIGMRITTRYAPSTNFTLTTTTRTTPVSTAPKALIAEPPAASRTPVTVSQWRTMPIWLSVKHTNTPTEYSGISAWSSPPKSDEQRDRDRRQEDDPPREREPVAAERELAGHVAVLGEERREPRERVVATCSRRGTGSAPSTIWNSVVQRRAVAEDACRATSAMTVGPPVPRRSGRSGTRRRRS